MADIDPKTQLPVVGESAPALAGTTDDEGNPKRRYDTSSTPANRANNQPDAAKPAAGGKPNGLRNRIIQRPPPLILDKVSNFYDGNCELSSVKTAPTIPEITKTSDSNAGNDRHPHDANSRLSQHRQDELQIATAATTTHQIESSTITETNSANHKFWASLNRNVSRSRAAAAAANSSQPTNGGGCSNHNRQTISDSVDPGSLGADLIISRRDTSGTNRQQTTLTCVLPSPMAKQKQAEQEIRLQPESPLDNCSLDELIHDDLAENPQLTNDSNEDLENQFYKDSPPNQHPRGNSSQSIEIDGGLNHFKQHNMSNLSSEPDDGGAPSEHGGGNLVGVDQPPTPTLLPNTHADGECSLASATSSRPRSNNPFLNDDEAEHEFNFNRSTSQAVITKLPNPAGGFNRPASFIAATVDKPGQRKQVLSELPDKLSNGASMSSMIESTKRLHLGGCENSITVRETTKQSQQEYHSHDRLEQTSANDVFDNASAQNQGPVYFTKHSIDHKDSSSARLGATFYGQTMTKSTIDAAQQSHLQLHHHYQQMNDIPPPRQHSSSMHNDSQKSIYDIYSQNPYAASVRNNLNHSHSDDYYPSSQPIQQEPTISTASENTVCKPPPSATMQLPHWTDAIYLLKNAIIETRSIGGGAENGEFIHIIESGDIILKLDDVKVSGYTFEEFSELLEEKPTHLLEAVQTKHSHGLTTDLKHYLSLSFPKDSKDRELQNLIRENVYRRTIPCTSRPPKDGEADKVDYHFLTKDQFVELNNQGALLECGTYGGHYYGTMKPFVDLDSYLYYGTLQQCTEVPDSMRQPLVANHPALVGLAQIPATQQCHPQPSSQATYSENHNPLYENHESMKMYQHPEALNNLTITNNPTLRDRPLPLIEPNSISSNSNGIASQQPPAIVAVDNEALPHGWERVIDQTHGTYYIDHNTQRTQYERPYEIELTKSSTGFGFTLVEADNGLLLVRSVITGGPAYSSGVIQPGDILISAVGVSVSGLAHTDVARLFSTFAVGDRVRLTFARSQYVVDANLVPDEYLFSNGTNGDLAVAFNSNRYSSTDDYGLNQMPVDTISATNNQQQHITTSSPNASASQEFDLITVVLKRGDHGFGFTIGDSKAGQGVRKIQNNDVCSNLKEGDILTYLNGQDITKSTHKEVVEKLKNCPPGEDVNLVVKRKRRFRSKTPVAMHTDNTGEFQHTRTPRRNCKTPNVDSLMLRRVKQQDPVSRTLFASNELPAPFIPSVPNQPPPLPYHHHSNPTQMTTNYSTLPQVTPEYIEHSAQSIYGLHQRPQPIIESQDHQIYYNAAPTNTGILYQSRPSSLANFEGLIGRGNGTESLNPSEISLPPVKFSNVNGLNQVNQYRTFMNNDKLMMMRMQQHQHHQHQPQHVPTSVSDNEYHQLYSNGEIMREQRTTTLPPVPLKPQPQQYLPTLNQVDNISNYYANNEELALQQIHYGSLPPMSTQNDRDMAMHHAQMEVGGSTASYLGTPAGYQQQMSTASNEAGEQDEYEYHQIDLDRQSTDSNWGIRLIGGSEVDRAISIGSIVNGGAASKNGRLKSGDEIISINGIDVVGATHQHVVEIISACSNRASLVIRRKKFAEACEVVLTKSSDEGFGFVIISSGNCALIGRIIEGSPAAKCQQLHVRDRIIAVNGRYITPNMQHPEIVNMIKECGSTLRLRIIPVDCYTVELIKSVQSDNFGFSMRGGSEYDGTPLYILRVAPNGLARDLLNVGDQIIEINGIPTVGMTHQQAATIIKYSDPIVKLKLRRNYETPPSLLVDSPKALQKFNQVTAEIKTVSNTTPTNFNQDLVGGSNSTDFGGGNFIASQQQLQSMFEQQPQQQHQFRHQPVGANQIYGQSLPLYAS